MVAPKMCGVFAVPGAWIRGMVMWGFLCGVLHRSGCCPLSADFVAGYAFVAFLLVAASLDPHSCTGGSLYAAFEQLLAHAVLFACEYAAFNFGCRYWDGLCR